MNGALVTKERPAPPWVWVAAGIGIGVFAGVLGAASIFALGKFL